MSEATCGIAGLAAAPGCRFAHPGYLLAPYVRSTVGKPRLWQLPEFNYRSCRVVGQADRGFNHGIRKSDRGERGNCRSARIPRRRRKKSAERHFVRLFPQSVAERIVIAHQLRPPRKFWLKVDDLSVKHAAQNRVMHRSPR